MSPSSPLEHNTTELSEQEFFQSVTQLYQSELTAFARSLIGNWHEAEDAVQKAFIQLLEAKRADVKIENVRAWLQTATRFRAISQRRSMSARNKVTQLMGDTGQNRISDFPAPSSIVEKKEDYAWLDRILKGLPDDHRRVYDGYYRKGKKLKEIAAELRVSPSTVTRIFEKVNKEVTGLLSLKYAERSAA